MTSHPIDLKHKINPSIACLCLILIVNAIALALSAFQGFNFYDYGAFLDASWRILKGQRPYVDFFYTTGPIHLYMNALFFSILGYGKLAILAHLITLSSIVIVITFVFTYRHSSLIETFVATCLSAAGFFWFYPHPWYDHTAYFWVILVVYIFITNHPFTKTKRAFSTAFACGILTFLVFMTKSNIGGVFFLSMLPVVLSDKQRVNLFLGYSLGILTATLCMAALLHPISAYIDNAFINYGAGATKQILRFTVLGAWLKNNYWIPSALLLLTPLPYKKESRTFVLIVLALSWTALFSLNTGSLRERTNLALLGVITALVFRGLHDFKYLFQSAWLQWLRQLISVILIATSAFQTYLCGKYYYKRNYDPKPIALFSRGTYKLQYGPFKGWLLDEKAGRLLDDMTQYINNDIPKDDRLLILSDMQILYSLTGRESYRGVSFLFHVGVMPAPGQQLAAVRGNILNNPPDWILTDRQEGYAINELIPYLALPSEFLAQYRLTKTWQRYGLFRKTE